MDQEEDKSGPSPRPCSHLGGGSKKVKACSSSISSHDQHHRQEEEEAALAPPPPSPLHLYSLPDIAHDAIACYLTMKDMHCMMESSPWLLNAYGGRVKEIKLLYGSRRDAVPATTTLMAIISRRPNVISSIVSTNSMIDVFLEAIKKGYLNKLQTLEIDSVNLSTPFWSSPKLASAPALCGALADGLCPKINKLELSGINDLVAPLGQALRSRMEKGYCGLKSLQMKGNVEVLWPVLSSGACEALEDLKASITTDNQAKEDLSEWLLRTRATQLRALTVCNITGSVATALCSPGVAPLLHVLELYRTDIPSASLLSQTIGGGSWPYLEELKVYDDCTGSSLVEAIGVGARRLVNLAVRARGPGGGVTVAGMLRDGGCPRLEVLNLKYNDWSDAAVGELARALEGGAPCSTTLRRLTLAMSAVTSVGMRELMGAVRRGALPHLESLDFSNDKRIGDGGVLAVTEAMAGGAFRSLHQLTLRDVGMNEMGAKSLFQALRDYNPCPYLKDLAIGFNELGDGAVVELAAAIETGALHHLQELNLMSICMGEAGFRALVKAIVVQQPNSGCPRLAVLGVNYNGGIGDGGAVYLAGAMKTAGAMQRLETMDMDNVGARETGFRALFHALEDSHVCPNLRRLDLGRGADTSGLLIGLKHSLRAKRGQDRRCYRLMVL